MARSGDAFFEEDWARADATDLGGAWVTTAGDAQIVQETLKQSTSAAQTARVYGEASTLASDMAAEVAVQGVFACSSDAQDRSLWLLLRWDSTDSIGYKVGLTWAQVSSAETLTLSIVKVDAVGTTLRETTLGSIAVTTRAYKDANDSYIDQFQNVRARIYDDSGEVTIEAKLNDEEEPLLRVTDREWPLFRGVGAFGVEFDEGEASPADGYLLVDYLAIQSISTNPDPASVQPTYWTFGKLKKVARDLALNDSSSTLNDDRWGDWVNASIQELYDYVGQPLWAETRWSFKLKAGETAVPMPPNAVDVDATVLDVGNSLPIPIIREDSHLESNPTETTTGLPIYFRLGGDARTLVLRPYPLASATRSYVVRYYGSPSHMYDDTEVPPIPDNLCEYICWGAVKRWAYGNGDRTAQARANENWTTGLRMARRLERRRASRTFNHRIGSGFHQGRERIYSDLVGARYGWRR